jgi:glycosyltransferase involved in cell wall biosynthesis
MPTLFLRHPRPHTYSIEKVFESILPYFPEEAEVRKVVLPHPSQGLWPRVKNIRFVRKQQGNVNHISGDVHFIVLGLPPQRTILTIHDLVFLERSRGWRKLLLQWFWITLPVKRAAVVTVISEATAKALRKYVAIPEEKLRIIPNPVDLRFQYAPKEFNSEYPTLLQIGTKENKNIPRLVQALEGIPCRLEIVGPLDENLLNLLQQHSIDYTQSQNLSDAEMLEKYRNCDLLTFVSTAEGFGLPILEAQATGRPVLTSNCSSMPEVAGPGACLVDPFDPAAIRAGLLRILGDVAYRDELIYAGLENVKRFHPQRIAGMYWEVYELIS